MMEKNNAIQNTHGITPGTDARTNAHTDARRDAINRVSTTETTAPELRFPDFHDNWQVKTFGDCFVMLRNGANYDTNNKDGYPMTRIETISSGNINFDRVGFSITEKKDYKLKKGDILFSHINSYEHIGKLAYYNDDRPLYHGMNLLLLRCIKEYDSLFIFYLLGTKHLKIKYQAIAKKAVNQCSISTKELSTLQLFLPSLPEQHKIAACLSSLDNLIKAVGNKIELLKQHKKGLMQKLFPKKECNVPELRFGGFEGEWEVKRLGAVAEKVSLKNKTKKQLPVFTNSAADGVVNQEDYFDREIITRDNAYNYQIIESDDFVYNPRISSIAPVGPISRNKIGQGIMSPLYTIFRFKEGDLNYLEQFFKTNVWHWYLKARANSGARFDRMNISNEVFFDMPISLPTLAEQRKIASCLSSIDAAIEETENKLQMLQQHKKGLMQRMFVRRL